MYIYCLRVNIVLRSVFPLFPFVVNIFNKQLMYSCVSVHIYIYL